MTAPTSGMPGQTGRPRNGLGITGFVLGLLAALFSLIPIIGVIAWPLSILGLVFGILGILRTGKGMATNKGMAIAGTVLAAIGLVICVLWLGLFGTFSTYSSSDSGTVEQVISPVEDGAQAKQDVTVSGCTVSSEDGMTRAEATVEITNSTGKPQSYLGTISVDAPDGSRLGEINIVSNSLAAGQEITLSGMAASTPLSGELPESVTCSVANVSRVAG